MRIIEVNLEDTDLTESKIQVNFSEVKICLVDVNAIKIHIKANIRTIAIQVINTKVIVVYIITHIEIFNKAIIMANSETEAMAVAEVITMDTIVVGPIIKATTITNTISITVMMMSTRQINMAHHVHYVVDIITPPNIVLRENMISMILWKRWILVDINHNQEVYIPKGEHDNPHELPKQQVLEGSTEIKHTLYSHTNTISSELNSFQKLDYIYQHFQGKEKIYKSDPDLARNENDNTLYPYINNDIEYGLFEDVISSYYLDSQIKDDFKCDQECYTDTQDYTLKKRLHHYLQLIPPYHVIIISLRVY